jgi:hypothetical protein
MSELKKNNTVNPFYAVEVGSIVRSGSGGFGATVIKAPITRLISDKDVRQSMTGLSSYVYTDKLNQGTLSVSGAYGVTGVSKMNAGLSAYVGNATAKLDKKITVNFNVQMLSGVEYINFDELQVDDLLNSLDGSTKEMALLALSAFNELTKKVGAANLLDLLRNPDQNPEVVKLVDEWVTSVQDFFIAHGDGIVVAVVWGGIGTVTLDMSYKSNENNWKYGGKGNFSYSSVGTAVNVGTTFDGSQSKKDSEVTVNTSSWASGACVQTQVEEWRKVVEGKGFGEICNISLLEKAPTIDKVSPIADPPPFQVPQKDPKATDKINQINSLDSLKLFCQASAYENAKATDKNLTLDDFLKKSAEKANTAAVSNVIAPVKANTVNPLQPSGPVKSSAAVQDAEIYQREEVAAPVQKKNDDFAALGVWITNWADLFPWMATGYLNEINNTDTALQIIRKQCMIQDFLTLGKIYFMLEASGISNTDFKMSAFSEIAQSFSQQAGYIKDNLNSKNKADLTQSAYNQLSLDAQKIYTKWNSIKFLRNAELGLGIIYDEKQSVANKIVKADNVASYTRVWYKTEDCSFLPQNYSAFSSFLKVIPFITPSGKIHAFGPSQMILNSIDKDGAKFSRIASSALSLSADESNMVLKSGNIVLYPIGFSAAKDTNVDWKGQNISTNVRAIRSINDHLDAVLTEMEGLNMYSFSDENWDLDWKPASYYSINTIKKQYIGLVDELHNVFDS